MNICGLVEGSPSKSLDIFPLKPALHTTKELDHPSVLIALLISPGIVPEVSQILLSLALHSSGRDNKNTFNKYTPKDIRIKKST